jgi:uncharacterized repeat protein (TIGR01451 family)
MSGASQRAVPREGTVSNGQRHFLAALLALTWLGPIGATFGQGVAKPAAGAGAAAVPAPAPLAPEPPALDAAPAPLPNAPALPTAAPDAAAAPAPTEPIDAPAPLDAQVEPAQAPAPPAGAPPAPPGGGAGAANLGAPFAIDPASLPVGSQAVQLSVQVLAPSAMTLHKPANVTIVVRNTGSTDAQGVVVRDQIPDGVKYVKSQPEAAVPPAGGAPGGFVAWTLGTLPAGSERKFLLTVEPVAKGPQDHAATVTLAAGARAKSVVLQPVLRVEQTVNRSSVLKGQQVQYDITITNDGDGPARNVVVRADLSAGLKHDPEGNILELDLASVYGKSVIQPRESVRLQPLIVDAVGGGEHTCTVKATSPDVADDSPTAQSVKTISIVEPQLKLTLDGSKKRPTDTIAEYTLTLSNPGTAPAQDVRVAARLTGDGRPYLPRGATWDAPNRRLVWTIPQLEPGGKTETFTFRIRLGGLGIFQVNAEAAGRGGLKEIASVSTSVEGIADCDIDVNEELRVLDVGQETVFKIRVRNLGTKEAHRVQVRATLTPNLEAVETAGTDQNAGLGKDNSVLFPEIEKLAAGAEMVLGIRARAKAPGLASCRVFLGHADLEGAQVEDVANANITDGNAAPK